MKEPVHIDRDKNCISQVREFMRNELEAFRLSDTDRNQITLAVEETCCNSIEHGHPSGNQNDFLLSVYNEGDDTVVIDIFDPAPPFDIATYESKTIENLSQTGANGGLGIKLIKTIMDKVEVVDNKGCCIYRLRKKLCPNSEKNK